MFTTTWSRGPFVHSVQTTRSHDEDDAAALSRHLATVNLVLDTVGQPDGPDELPEAPEPAAAAAPLEPAPPAAPVA